MLTQINTDDIKCLQTEKPENAVAINLVSSDSLDKWQANLSSEQLNWCRKHNFKAKSGELIFFSDNGGNFRSIAAGTGSEPYDPWLFSKIAETLPDGIYYIENELSSRNSDYAVFGWAMAHYNFDYYLKEKNSKNAVLSVPYNCNFNLVSSIIKGTVLTRDLVNIPTCDMGPSELEKVAKNLSEFYGASFSVTVGDALLKSGFNTIHTVGRAAEKEPRLIDFSWGDEKAPKLTLVGKGVCFDTGGLDIKPSSAMLTMKKDMGGAAHVLGLARIIMENKLPVRLRVLIPAVENNISGNAFRPGDIIKSYKGTTIEVGNTDAEGRLVLCDALALASEENPDLIIDFATLTGAARVALGADVPPFFSDDKEISAALLNCSEEEFDPLWPLPLYRPYKKLLHSSIAEINNVANTGFAGAITAALFLKEFVGEAIPWVHLDVYAWNASARPGKPIGGEAMGLRTVYNFLARRYRTGS
ncbi:MAG: leucyl aminopeptidase family protein [Emcibacteraceae bacterium]